MDTFSGNYFNLNIDLISFVLIPYIEPSIRYKIKECITSVHQVYGCTITKRKAFLGHKRAFEIVYGNWDKSFASLSRYMVALKHFNPRTVVEWKLERSLGISEHIFRYVFWAFKPVIDGFVHCRPVISVDDTHVYGKYDIKSLIDVAVDANGSIFPLVFSICTNESQETWTLFLNHLNEHVVRHRSGIYLIYDRHGGILSSVQNLHAWQEPYAYHCYCVTHLKANFQRAYPNKDLYDLMWMTPTDHQECKFRRRMKLIRLLKSARGLPVIAMVWMSFKQMAERFAERSRGFVATRYVDKEYSVDAYLNTYSGQLQPVGAEHYWPSEPFKMVCNEDYVRQLQVQKRTRIRNQIDIGNTVYTRKCGICSQTGHNRHKCPSSGLGSGGNLAPGDSSSNAPNYQG
ncbi:uncharacterized protein [Nicotiana tomentosiformis]|uniref:uncharacterized protein n=1 Tax=Nicotiana tomentosiformis TaxID=4098 RepID=UPI00388C9E73